MYINLFLGIMLALLGISLIGTTLQHKVKLVRDSQNMFWGCVGGLIAFGLGLDVVWSIVVFVVSIIVSVITFKYFLSKDIFNIKSDKIRHIILGVSVCIIISGVIIMMIPSNINIFLINPVEFIGILFIIINAAIGIPMFVKFAKSYNPDELNNGECIYIVDSAIDPTPNATTSYNNKKVYMKSMHYIINKECVVKNFNGKNIIDLNGLSYPIIEKNNEILTPGDMVLVSKDNINKGIIRQNDEIIVEKNMPREATKNKKIRIDWIVASTILFGMFWLIMCCHILYFNNFYLDTHKTIVLKVGEIQQEQSEEHTRFYRKTMVNYNGETITFDASEQTVRDLPKEGEIITVYKNKNGYIDNLTFRKVFLNILFILIGIGLEIWGIVHFKKINKHLIVRHTGD